MPIGEEYAGQLRHGTADAFYKIKLRLNAAERAYQTGEFDEGERGAI